jgi:hypothetical protein
MATGTFSDVLGIAATLIVGVATIFFAYGYRRQLGIRTAERRIGAYGDLWSLTYVARPSRHMAEGSVLTDDERRELWVDMSKWYFRAGNGMLMTESTRALYFTVKDNLLADGEALEPQRARRRLAALSGGELAWARGKLAMDQLSLLRTQMKSDLDIYGRHYGDPPDDEDADLLRVAKLNPNRRPWRARAM